MTFPQATNGGKMEGHANLDSGANYPKPDPFKC